MIRTKEYRYYHDSDGQRIDTIMIRKNQIEKIELSFKKLMSTLSGKRQRPHIVQSHASYGYWLFSFRATTS